MVLYFSNLSHLQMLLLILDLYLLHIGIDIKMMNIVLHLYLVYLHFNPIIFSTHSYDKDYRLCTAADTDLIEKITTNKQKTEITLKCAKKCLYTNPNYVSMELYRRPNDEYTCRCSLGKAQDCNKKLFLKTCKQSWRFDCNSNDECKTGEFIHEILENSPETAKTSFVVRQ